MPCTLIGAGFWAANVNNLKNNIMTEITFNIKQSRPAIKCGDWLLVDGYLCVITQTDTKKFQLIGIENEIANRANIYILTSNNGFITHFTDEELKILTGDKGYQKVNVSITVT